MSVKLKVKRLQEILVRSKKQILIDEIQQYCELLRVRDSRSFHEIGLVMNDECSFTSFC